MSETTALSALAARLEVLRASAAAKPDSVRLAYLEALARRAARQRPAVQRRLIAKIQAATDELSRPPAKALTETPSPNDASPLAELLAYLYQRAHTLPQTTQSAGALNAPKVHPTHPPGRRHTPELKSVAYFRDEWSKLSSEQQLTQTLAQAPENAGPMNSQHLVLRSLQVMRDIAPDYLHGFMSHIDALIWLEHASTGRGARAPQPRSAFLRIP